jgi:hypothetical protein
MATEYEELSQAAAANRSSDSCSRPSFDNARKRISVTTELRTPMPRGRVLITTLCYFGGTEFKLWFCSYCRSWFPSVT